MEFIYDLLNYVYDGMQIYAPVWQPVYVEAQRYTTYLEEWKRGITG